MNNADLIDDYLANKMPEQDKLAFENKLKEDAALQKELDFQQSIVTEIQQARVAELKGLMNNIPSGAWQTDATNGTIKIVAAVIGGSALLISAYLLFLNPTEEITVFNPDEIEVTDLITEEISEFETEEVSSTDEVNTSADVKTEATAEIKKIEKKKESVSQSPKINVMDFSEEVAVTDESKVPEVISSENEFVNVSTLIIETNDSDANYDFHYQFTDGKLLLYGKFDKSIYEVLEFNLNKEQLIYFYYKDKFYQLDAKQRKITPLVAISDAALINKLNAQRLK
jgi:hypothetical protein